MLESPHGTSGESGRPDVERALEALRHHLRDLEQLVVGDSRAEARTVEQELPGWLRPHRGEERWPVTLAVAVAVALQVLLPDKLVFGPDWLLPGLEAVLGLGLIVANPRRINRTSAALRTASIVLIVLISIANGWSTSELIHGIVRGTLGQHAGSLLASGASIYVTNVIVFALWYWEWDRGGPALRATGGRQYPDFLFPQMTADGICPPNWHPTFTDYLYVSYTNATAFSPTDTMPLVRWAKLLMGFQSAIALVTMGLVIARAVNIFP